MISNWRILKFLILCIIIPAWAGQNDNPKIALVFDDFGYLLPSSDVYQGFLNIDCPIAVSIIPGLPHSTQTAEDFFKAGKEVLIHMPMEAVNSYGREPICLLTGMGADTIRGLFYQSMVDIPCCVGISNHQGSKFTGDSLSVSWFISILKDTELFCIDNLTTPKTVLYDRCRNQGIPVLKRDVFLDTNLEEGETITGRFKQLARIAKSRGYAVGVGHRYKKTLTALQNFLNSPDAEEVEIVLPSVLLP
ncbi:divergent polysaccharide deacetylase family protein [bacterium]|nr:divergent polysaccharide deacetylase family protein [FCB group bacterium]MBL7190457.1 divergent polysaccharide deacetylase family protein [bacterium]